MTVNDLASLIAWASLVFAVVAAPVWLYLGVLTLFSWPKRPPDVGAPLRLVCVVPAHDEETGIAGTVRSLLSAEYPSACRRVLVVADNCTDRTAARAVGAGARVLERRDEARRGKGFALEAAFRSVLADDFAQGVLVVDADTVVSPNFWHATSARIATGSPATQLTNAVRNPDAGWRPRLQAIAMAMINGVRSLGRDRLGLSVGLRGTGMAFARSTLERVPHEVHGVVEDVEYGLRLGMAGIRVAFAPEAWVSSDAPATADAALSQRRRWEGGRLALTRTLLPRVLGAAVSRRSVVLLDLAIDLMIPPISYPAIAVAAGLCLEAGHVVVSGAPSSSALVWAICVLSLVATVLRGVAFSRTGARGLAALAFAPAYICWKIFVARPWKRTDAWVRTRRPSEFDGIGKDDASSRPRGESDRP